MKKSGPGDHAWSDSVHFIWAHGIEPDEFYAVDELKYHGGNRGSAEIRKGPLTLYLLYKAYNKTQHF